MAIAPTAHRALPIPKSEDPTKNELRYRAEVERGFATVDIAIRTINTLSEKVADLETRIAALEAP